MDGWADGSEPFSSRVCHVVVERRNLCESLVPAMMLMVMAMVMVMMTCLHLLHMHTYADYEHRM
jgi:hypothetical protein